MNVLFKSTVLFSFVLIVTFSHHAQAQEAVPSKDFARNSVFLELLGNGGLYTLNYDHKFFDHVSARLGLEYISLSGDDGGTGTDDRVTIFLAPIMVNYLVGNGNSRLELGAGTYLGGFSGDVENEVVDGIGGGGFTGTIGYRLQPRDGGFLFRVGITPIISAAGAQLWGGLSLGGTF